MNKLDNKGFTLIEVLAVITILAIVIVIVATSGLSAFDNTKNKLKEEDKKAIVEAAKVLMTEVIYCDEDIGEELLKNINAEDFSNINGLTGTDPSTPDYPSCENLLIKAKGPSGLKITLDYLIDNKLVTGNEIEKMEGKGITYTGKLDSNNDINIIEN